MAKQKTIIKTIKELASFDSNMVKIVKQISKAQKYKTRIIALLDKKIGVAEGVIFKMKDKRTSVINMHTEKIQSLYKEHDKIVSHAKSVRGKLMKSLKRMGIDVTELGG